jgi:hypothetical protein
MKKYWIVIILLIVMTSCYKEVIFNNDDSIPCAIFTYTNIDSTYIFDATESYDADACDTIYLKWCIDNTWTDYIIGHDNIFYPIDRIMITTFISGTHVIKLRVKDTYGWNDMTEEIIIVN